MSDTVWYWHIHHDILCEPVIGSIQERIRFIHSQKPAHELATRLRLMQPVRQLDRLPALFVEAWKAYVEAWKAYVEARKAYVEARKAVDEARKAVDEARKAVDEARKAVVEAWKACQIDLERLHVEECPGCPWNGKEIVFAQEART